MNRLLKELAEEAGYPDYMTYGQDLILERFAELIVRECAKLTRWQEYDMSVEQRIRLGIYQEIKEHFGVES
jgi:hypothetical protein